VLIELFNSLLTTIEREVLTWIIVLSLISLDDYGQTTSYCVKKGSVFLSAVCVLFFNFYGLYKMYFFISSAKKQNFQNSLMKKKPVYNLLLKLNNSEFS